MNDPGGEERRSGTESVIAIHRTTADEVILANAPIIGVGRNSSSSNNGKRFESQIPLFHGVPTVLLPTSGKMIDIGVPSGSTNEENLSPNLVASRRNPAQDTRCPPTTTDSGSEAPSGSGRIEGGGDGDTHSGKCQIKFPSGSDTYFISQPGSHIPHTNTHTLSHPPAHSEYMCESGNAFKQFFIPFQNGATVS